MSAAPARDALEVRLSAAGQLRVVGGLLLFCVLFGLFWARGRVSPWLAGAGLVEFGAFSLVGAVAAVRTRGQLVARLSPVGVERDGLPVVPWSDLREVVITGLQPWWLFWLGRPRYPVVAFLPRPGVQLPLVRRRGSTWQLRGPSWRDRPQRRLYGTSLLFMPHAMTVTADQMACAAQEWGGLPVSRRSSPR